MKHILTAFVAIIFLLEMIYPVGAVNAPNVDEIELMLKKVENNMKMASAVVSVAKAKGEALVESKVEEKAELKQAVEMAESKVAIYATKMLESGIDTATIDNGPIYKGPLYEAFLEYQKNGGTDDFEFFRVYIYK
jgi:ABC-type uncharacterized transport system substrate-binding protein